MLIRTVPGPGPRGAPADVGRGRRVPAVLRRSAPSRPPWASTRPAPPPAEVALRGSVFENTAAKCHLGAFKRAELVPGFRTVRRRRCWFSGPGCGELGAWFLPRSPLMSRRSPGRAGSTATAPSTAAGGRPWPRTRRPPHGCRRSRPGCAPGRAPGLRQRRGRPPQQGPDRRRRRPRRHPGRAGARWPST